jgi:hypothetical protein
MGGYLSACGALALSLDQTHITQFIHLKSGAYKAADFCQQLIELYREVNNPFIVV